LVAAAADALGFEGREPASLRFVEAAEKKVELEMELPVRVVRALQTIGALALMDFHGRASHSKPCEDKPKVL
jgi:hypothetical protein